MILAQVQIPGSGVTNSYNSERKTIKSQPFCDKAKQIDYEIQNERYDGSKNPPMPTEQALRQVPPLKFLVTQDITLKRTQKK